MPGQIHLERNLQHAESISKFIDFPSHRSISILTHRKYLSIHQDQPISIPVIRSLSFLLLQDDFFKSGYERHFLLF